MTHFSTLCMRVNHQDIVRDVSARTRRDYELINAVVERDDPKACAALVQRYRTAVYHVALKMVRHPDDAQDLTMEVFAKAFRHLASFSPEYAFSTWLLRIATNSSIDFLRRKRLPTVSMHGGRTPAGGAAEPTWEFADAARTPQEELVNAQKKELVRRWVDQLPPRYRRLVQLRYFDERSYGEIAQEMQAPLGTVKAQLHRARELLLDMAQGSQRGI